MSYLPADMQIGKHAAASSPPPPPPATVSPIFSSPTAWRGAVAGNHKAGYTPGLGKNEKMKKKRGGEEQKQKQAQPARRRKSISRRAGSSRKLQPGAGA